MREPSDSPLLVYILFPFPKPSKASTDAGDGELSDAGDRVLTDAGDGVLADAGGGDLADNDRAGSLADICFRGRLFDVCHDKKKAL